MKEFIDRLKSRLEEEKFDMDNCRYDVDLNTTIDTAISIITELAEEYKGGWIPCSERMPEIGQMCMWTVNKKKHPDAPYDIILGSYHLDLDYDIWKSWALAWKPLPEPYKEVSK